MAEPVYNGVGQLRRADYEFTTVRDGDMVDDWTRSYTSQYDELGMLESSAIETDEPGSTIVRSRTIWIGRPGSTCA